MAKKKGESAKHESAEKREHRERLERAAASRVASAREKRATRQREGDVYAAMIRGDRAKDAGVAALSGDWNKTELPLLAKHDTALAAAVYFQKPRIINNVPDGAPPVAVRRSIIEERKLAYYVRETDLMDQLELAFADARPYGRGFVELSFDQVRGHSCARFVPFSQALVDNETDHSTRSGDQRWTGRELTMSLSAAKERWPDYKFSAYDEPGAASASPTLRVREEQTADPASIGAGNSGQPEGRVRIVRLYLNGDNPETPKGDITAGPGEPVEEGESEGGSGEEPEQVKDTEALFDHGVNEVAYFEVRADNTLKLIEKRPCDYVIDLDATPIIGCSITVDVTDYYSVPVFRPYWSLANQADWMMSVVNTDARVHSMIRWVLDSEVFTPSDVEKLLSGKHNDALLKPNVRQVVDAMKKIDFGQPSPVARQAADLCMALYGQLSNLEVITLEGSERSHQSATVGALQDKRAQLLVAMYASKFEAFVCKVFRMLAQIDRSLMTREQVAAIVGADVVDEEAWPEKMEPEEIRREYWIDLETRSMRFVSEDQQAQELTTLLTQQTQMLAAASKMPPGVAALFIRSANATLSRVSRILHIPNAQELMIDPEELLAAMQPPAPPEPAPQTMAPSSNSVSDSPSLPVPPAAAAPLQNSGMNSQAITKMAILIARGQLDPKQAPPEARQLASEMLQDALRQKQGIA